MAVPKRKTSPSRRGMRRSADALKAPTYVEDKDSGELRRPHHIDLKTGMYRGRQVLNKKPKRKPCFPDAMQRASGASLIRDRGCKLELSRSRVCSAPLRAALRPGKAQTETTIMFALGFPLLLVPFAIYNMIAFLMAGVSWTAPVTTVHMMSGQDWVLTWEDVLLALSILLLWIEIIKSTRLGMRSVMDHILAMVLFIAMLVEFLLVQQAGTSTFFLLMMIALVDVLSGFIIGMRSGRRQVEIDTAKDVA